MKTTATPAAARTSKAKVRARLTSFGSPNDSFAPRVTPTAQSRWISTNGMNTAHTMPAATRSPRKAK
jgi:hypothetical protein